MRTSGRLSRWALAVLALALVCSLVASPGAYQGSRIPSLDRQLPDGTPLVVVNNRSRSTSR